VSHQVRRRTSWRAMARSNSNAADARNLAELHARAAMLMVNAERPRAVGAPLAVMRAGVPRGRVVAPDAA
jgi:hypothetical protein